MSVSELTFSNDTPHTAEHSANDNGLLLIADIFRNLLFKSIYLYVRCNNSFSIFMPTEAMNT